MATGEHRQRNSRTMRTGKRSLLAAAALMLALSGCGGIDSGQAGATQQEGTSGDEQAVLEYLSGPAEINTALQKAGAQCMREAGFTSGGWEARLRAHESISEISGRFESEEDAKFRGYSTTLWIPETYPTLSYLSSAQRQAMYGSRPQLDSRNLRPQKYDWGKSTAPSAPNLFTPIAVTADPAEYGCKGIAVQKVFGSLENYATYEALYPELRQLGARSAEAARKVHDENRGAYQQCLEDAGFNNVGAPPLVAERAEAIAGLYRGEGVLTNAKEQQLAAADYACDKKLHYFEKLDQAVLSANREWVQQNAGRIQQVKRIRDEATARAKTM